MPTVMTHAIVPLAAMGALGTRRVPIRLALAAAILAVLPDVDVVGFRLGVAYSDGWGHRGATHSLAIAVLTSSIAVAAVREWRGPFAWVFLFLAAASHGLLDMLTSGGLGVALFWPFETGRHFFPATPISVSPIGTGFFSARGLTTILSEMKWVWLPCAILAAAGMAIGAMTGNRTATKWNRRC